MYKRIPDCITFSVCNKCVWEVFKKVKVIDSELDLTTNYETTGIFINSIEPVPINEQDKVYIANLTGVVMSQINFKLWFKSLEVDLNLNNLLKLVIRKDPCGKDLPLFDGYFKLLTGTGDGIYQDKWFYLEKTG